MAAKHLTKSRILTTIAGTTELSRKQVASNPPPPPRRRQRSQKSNFLSLYHFSPTTHPIPCVGRVGACPTFLWHFTHDT
jgi:hypothetical protein